MDFLKYRTDSVSFQLPVGEAIITEPKNYLVYPFIQQDEKPIKAAVWFPNLGKIFIAEMGNGKILEEWNLPILPKQDIFSFCIDEQRNCWCCIDGQVMVFSKTGKSRNFSCQARVSNEFYVYPFDGNQRLRVKDSMMELCMVPKNGAYIERTNTDLRDSLLPNSGIFQIIGDSLILKTVTSYFPSSYRKSYHYAQKAIAARTSNANFYLYADGDSIMSKIDNNYTYKNVEAIKSIEPFFKPDLLVEDSISDINYVMRHFTVYGRPFLFLYDSYKNIFYLGMKQEQDFLQEDGVHVNNSREFPFIIYLLNSEFKVINSIVFPKGRFMMFSSAFVSKKGLNIMTKPTISIGYETYNFFNN